MQKGNKFDHKSEQWNQYLTNAIWQQFEWKQAFRATSLTVSICHAVLFSDPLQPYYRGLPFKSVPMCLRLQAKQSHMPHCRVTPHLLNFSTGHARRHTCAHTHTQWPGKWNRGEGWYESVFAFEKPKEKLSDLDLKKWRRERSVY